MTLPSSRPEEKPGLLPPRKCQAVYYWSEAIATLSVDPGFSPQAPAGGAGPSMPAVGLGTSGPTDVNAEQVAEAVPGAFEAGYRHFDCASVYGNEEAIGRALQQLPRDGSG